MKYYEGCKLTVDIPASGGHDEGAIRDALLETLPGIEVVFRRSSSTTVLEAAGAFVPDGHPVAGAEEHDAKTNKWVSVGGRSILMAASDVLTRFQEHI